MYTDIETVYRESVLILLTRRWFDIPEPQGLIILNNSYRNRFFTAHISGTNIVRGGGAHSFPPLLKKVEKKTQWSLAMHYYAKWQSITSHTPSHTHYTLYLSHITHSISLTSQTPSHSHHSLHHSHIRHSISQITHSISQITHSISQITHSISLTHSPSHSYHTLYLTLITNSISLTSHTPSLSHHTLHLSHITLSISPTPRSLWVCTV